MSNNDTTNRESSGHDDDDKFMEELFEQIVSSPCTTQDEAAQGCKLSIADSAEVIDSDGDKTSGLDLVEMDSCTDRAKQVREGKEAENHATYVNGEAEILDYSFARKWTDETEVKRMLDEMIAMTGLADVAEVGFPYDADYSDLMGGFGSGVDLGVNLELSTLSGWDMDVALGSIGAH